MNIYRHTREARRSLLLQGDLSRQEQLMKCKSVLVFVSCLILISSAFAGGSIPILVETGSFRHARLLPSRTEWRHLRIP